MSETITPDQLEKAISDIVKDYTNEQRADAKKAISKVGKQTAETLRNTAPKRTGKYAKGWKSKNENDGYDGFSNIVYNTTKPSLTHLLEFGHGGTSPAPAHPHIDPAYAKGRSLLLEELKK